MGDRVHFLTHPEVEIDPAVPVPRWPLSAVGLARMRLVLGQDWLPAVRSVWCSDEQKAIDGARVVAEHLGLEPRILAGLAENDRSATGFLPPPEFQATADQFFARPEESVRGWERAVDAQRRVVAAVDELLAADRPAGDVAIVSHGGVGALLLCHLSGVGIDRSYDQPGGGGGNRFAFDAASRELLCGWRPFEADAQAV